VWALGATAGVVAVGATGVELVAHDVLPGKSLLDELDGACDVGVAHFKTSGVGELVSGSFYSRARRRLVGYSVGYPPGHPRGSELPLIVMLHGEGGSHKGALPGLTPAEAVSLIVDGSRLAPMALVTVDGGRGYWHPHPDDDPMGMVVDELLPMLSKWGLGGSARRTATMGISMGGYGAILFAELYPELFGAVAAISPAVWTSYSQASAVNAMAYDSAAQFARFDVITHAASLAATPVRIAAGFSDPFYPGVSELSRHLGSTATLALTGGCHTGPFFRFEEPPSLGFLSTHLTSASQLPRQRPLPSALSRELIRSD
jgi:pimeloyl-ACP methyl ester carboxylesterase